MREILKREHDTKITEQYFPVVMLITLCKAVIAESVDEILKCDHSKFAKCKCRENLV